MMSRPIWEQALEIRRRGRHDSGQAAFEFLLIIPFFIYFMLLLIDFGILMFAYVSVANGAREGARFAAANCAGSACTASLVQTRTSSGSSGFLATSDVTVQWNAATVGSTTFPATKRGSNVVVAAERSHNLLFFPWATIPVQSCSVMRLERDDSGAGLPSGGGC